MAKKQQKKQSKITKVLIVNRSEIALRIQRACKILGLKSVSVCSDVDASSLFARSADELYRLGGSTAFESYLNIDKLITAAKETGCDAVHPGYGFLSENAEFAQRVVDAGLIFVGPSPEAIQILGSKTEARKRVTEYGVPCTPGAKGGLSDKELVKRAQEIGFPVIIKAVAGGGGRGMRVVKELSEMKDALPRARAEGKKNFSSDDVYLEKYIEMPRHVEVQVFGDSHGNVVHFGTRDCSSQRRHQKLIEEAPAPFINEKVREEIHQAAVNAAKSVNYENAGTVEFLLSGDQFYFLEMNTRIQVEHPVTEEVTDTDLVKLQFEVAQGGKVPEQNEIKFTGHSIEFRIYAEDPANNFAPAIGTVSKISRPEADYIREDYGVESGDTISPYYDAMISKLIVNADSREQAIERSYQALRGYKVEGLKTTIPFHKWLLLNKDFKKSCIDIGYIEREFTPADKLVAEVEAAEIVDPKFKTGPDGLEVVEYFQYASDDSSTKYTVEVLHRRDGVFVVTPINADGERARNRNCRASNGMQTAINALISDVLEKLSSKEIFS